MKRENGGNELKKEEERGGGEINKKIRLVYQKKKGGRRIRRKRRKKEKKKRKEKEKDMYELSPYVCGVSAYAYGRRRGRDKEKSGVKWSIFCSSVFNGKKI